MFWNPTPVLETIGDYVVVRDDVLPGGTKQRGLIPFMMNHPCTEFVYASPAYGYAQIAMAISARQTGKQATIFTARRRTLHPLTIKAHKLGAKIIQVPNGYLNVVQKRASDYALMKGAFYMPFGANVREIGASITEAARLIPLTPEEVWTVSGSGTLTRALQVAWPGARFHTVIIGKRSINTGSSTTYIAPESFEQPAQYRPPFPSCKNYDAKAWRFFRHYAGKGALFWNVAS